MTEDKSKDEKAKNGKHSAKEDENTSGHSSRKEDTRRSGYKGTHRKGGGSGGN
jgi:hypothetical protein